MNPGQRQTSTWAARRGDKSGSVSQLDVHAPEVDIGIGIGTPRIHSAPSELVWAYASAQAHTLAGAASRASHAGIGEVGRGALELELASREMGSIGIQEQVQACLMAWAPTDYACPGAAVCRVRVSSSSKELAAEDLPCVAAQKMTVPLLASRQVEGRKAAGATSSSSCLDVGKEGRTEGGLVALQGRDARRHPCSHRSALRRANARSHIPRTI